MARKKTEYVYLCEINEDPHFQLRIFAFNKVHAAAKCGVWFGRNFPDLPLNSIRTNLWKIEVKKC